MGQQTFPVFVIRRQKSSIANVVFFLRKINQMGFSGVGGNYVQPGKLSAFRCQDLAWYLPQEGYRTGGVPARAFRTVPACLGASVNTSGGVTTVTLVSVVCELLKFDFSAFAWSAPSLGSAVALAGTALAPLELGNCPSRMPGSSKIQFGRWGWPPKCHCSSPQ